jgi:hypothetical protein
MKLVLLALALIFVSTDSFAKVGSPTKIRCSLAKLTYKEDIVKLMDINDLLKSGDYTYSKEAVQDITCDTYQGEVTVCASVIEKNGIYVRYHFNSQNGALTVEDLGTGHSSYTSWLNQENVTKSGYLQAGTWLTNRRGGLMGSKRIFQVETDCWALEWKK